MKFGRLILRIVIGTLFVGHGTQKLFGWFGGPGLDGFTGMTESLGLHPARENAIAAATTETAGGAMLVAGAMTPVAATGLIATMITAIRTVHFKNGPWSADGGYEFNLVMIAGLLALVDGGPGELSVDRALGLDGAGHRTAIAALAAGAAGSAMVIGMGRSRAEAEAGPATEDSPAA